MGFQGNELLVLILVPARVVTDACPNFGENNILPNLTNNLLISITCYYNN